MQCRTHVFQRIVEMRRPVQVSGLLKPPEHGLGLKWKQISIPKTANNCVLNHKLQVPCDSYEKNCAQTRIFSNTLFNMRGNYFLVQGTDK